MSEKKDQEAQEVAGAAVESPVEALTRARDEAEQAKAAMQDRLLRLQADFENFRKRSVRERAELIRTANEDLMSELLPVVDHFELALGAATPERLGGAHHGGQASPSTGADAILKGVQMVREQLLAALGKFGLQPLDAAVGKDFDPARHEAISHLPSDEVAENGVITQTRRGYLLGDKLIRPAQVVVSSGKPGVETAAPENGTDGGE